jgi:hypothetical protein
LTNAIDGGGAQAAPQAPRTRKCFPTCIWYVPLDYSTPEHELIHPQRRRAQNRASQRAFRERKERHVKGLEHQLEDLHEKHQDLLQSYSRKADEVVKLNARIQELNSEIEALRTSSDLSFSDFLAPDKFDAVPGSDMYYSGPECYFDKNAVDRNSEFALSQLEDTL